MWNGWVIGILGIWTGIIPFFSATPAFYSWSNWIVGIITAVLGFSMLARRPAQGWITGVVGIWLFIAGFIQSLLMGSGLWWNNVIVGLVFLIFGFSGAGGAVQHRTMGSQGHAAGHSPA
ncbi:MAG: hypothetical protein P8Z36_02255 [Gemmatimonadota bacterium]|jgi:hypothetical protein